MTAIPTPARRPMLARHADGESAGATTQGGQRCTGPGKARQATPSGRQLHRTDRECEWRRPICPASARPTHESGPDSQGDLVKIDIGRGLFALVDPAFAHLASLAWSRKIVGRKGRTQHTYAARNETVNGKRTTVYMHRLIAGATSGQEVDHVNRNTLDNRRSNLRVGTHNDNMQNRNPHRRSLTGIVGVSWQPKRRRYEARVIVNGTMVLSKRFKSLDEAIVAVRSVRERHTPHALIALHPAVAGRPDPSTA
jgi:hypothetical protein